MLFFKKKNRNCKYYRILCLFSVFVSTSANMDMERPVLAMDSPGVVEEVNNNMAIASDLKTHVLKKFVEAGSIQLYYSLWKAMNIFTILLLNAAMVVKNINAYTVFLLLAAKIAASVIDFKMKLPRFIVDLSVPRFNYLNIFIHGMLNAVPSILVVKAVEASELSNLGKKEYNEEHLKICKNSIMHTTSNSTMLLANIVAELAFSSLLAWILVQHPQKYHFNSAKIVTGTEFYDILKKNNKVFNRDYKFLGFRFITTKSGLNGGVVFAVEDRSNGQQYIIHTDVDKSSWYFSNGSFNYEDDMLGLSILEKVFTYGFIKKLLLTVLSTFLFSQLLPEFTRFYKRTFGGYTFIITNYLEEAGKNSQFKFLMSEEEQANNNKVDVEKVKNLRFTLDRLRKSIYLDVEGSGDALTQRFTELIEIMNEFLDILTSITKNMSSKEKAECLKEAYSVVNRFKHCRLVGPPGIGKTLFSLVKHEMIRDAYKVVDIVILRTGILPLGSVPQIIKFENIGQVLNYADLRDICEEVAIMIKDPNNRDKDGVFHVPTTLQRIINKLNPFTKEPENINPLNAILVIDDVTNIGQEKEETGILEKALGTLRLGLGVKNTDDMKTQLAAYLQRIEPQKDQTIKISVNGTIYSFQCTLYNPKNTSLNITGNYLPNVKETPIHDRVPGFSLRVVDTIGKLEYITGLNDGDKIKNSPIYLPDEMVEIIKNDRSYMDAIKKTIKDIKGIVEDFSISQKLPFLDLLNDASLLPYAEKIKKNSYTDVEVDYMRKLLEKHGNNNDDEKQVRVFIAFLLANKSSFYINAALQNINNYITKAKKQDKGLTAKELLSTLRESLDSTNSLKATDLASIDGCKEQFFLTGFKNTIYCTIKLQVIFEMLNKNLREANLLV